MVGSGADSLFVEDGSDAVNLNVNSTINFKNGVNGDGFLDGVRGTDTMTTNAIAKPIPGFTSASQASRNLLSGLLLTGSDCQATTETNNLGTSSLRPHGMRTTTLVH
jgi:hypothetical protein